ncbi:peptidase family M3 [Beauveria bassiana ARSEF 2860]|uniref:Peptidase family M3 n=1 Tax=Beauveria bassiana (strain ARSEF 2860) TaxID=655819 RepID=J5JCS7_BEAB2|nr:peptidase family M3 [Beauveria bassiana ARSEF 2860]EJP61656.1 peptidase family M3 [Beauveria bassiana ARSEF 2860]
MCQDEFKIAAVCPQPLPRIYSADEIVPVIERIIIQMNATRDHILRNVTKDDASFDTVMRPLVDVEQENNSDIGVIWMLQYGAPDKETHDAFSKARQLLISAEASWNASEEMYTILGAARDNEKDLDTASKLLLDKTLLEYKLSGCGTISKQDKEAFAKDTIDLENLLAEARSNIAQESGGIWLADEDLQDLPAEELDRIKKHKQPMETPPQEGMTFVPFSNGGTVAVLTFARNPDVRKKMYLADQKKLLRNIPLLRDIVKRRQNLAQRLGYNTHAERRMETRLLKGPDQVKELLDSLSSGLVSRGRREMDMLQKMRLKDLQKLGRGGDSTLQSSFPPWDLKYYQRLVSSSRKVDESAVSEYFPLEYVIPQMLQIFEDALGLRFDCIPKTELIDAKIWHNTVTVFSVWDTRQDEPAFMGYLYFDLLWRENKFRGAHNVTMEFGFEKSNGGRKYPSTIVMSAFPTVGDEGCVLLKHHQLITIFHELGHAIHNLVSRTKYLKFHGTSLPPDFVEIPSLMLENWCWIPQILVSMSTHYSHLRPEYREKWQRVHPGEEQPPKQLPDEIAHALVKYRYSGRGLYHLFQLSISLFDLAIHSAGSAEEAESMNVQKVWYDIRERTEGFDFAEVRETGSDLVAFAHLLGGYDMAYYSYLCCSSFAQDLFQSLFAVDPTNTNAWERYRQMVLQPGAEHPDLLKLLGKVLGHAPNATALINVLENADL